MDWCGSLGFHDVDVDGDGWRTRVHVGGAGDPLVLVHGNPTHGYRPRPVRSLRW